MNCRSIMHELSIALSILDTASAEAKRQHLSKITAIHLRLGPLAGVDRDALASAYGLAREGSDFGHCELIIEETPIISHCAKCAAERTISSLEEILCPACGHPADVRSGRDLEVTAFEVEV